MMTAKLPDLCGPPFYDEPSTYLSLWNRFRGWEYIGWKAESMSWKTGCYIHAGLSDTQMNFTGPDVVRFFEALCVNNFEKFSIGSMKHAVFCTDGGLIAAHGILQRNTETELRLFAAPPWPVYRAMAKKFRVEAQFPRCYLFQVAGPTSLETLECAADESLRDVGFLRFRDAKIADKRVEIGRIGMSGNRAYEMKVHGKNILFTQATDLAQYERRPPLDGVPFLAPWAILGAIGLLAACRFVGLRVRGAPMIVTLIVLFLGYSTGEAILAARTDHTIDDTAFIIRCRDEVPAAVPLYIDGKLGPPGNLDFFRLQFYSRPDALLLHNLSFLRAQNITSPIVYVIARAKDRPLLDQLGTVQQIDQSLQSHEIETPAGRFTLFRLTFDPHLLRYPAPAYITSLQAMERAPGPLCGPPLQ